MEYANFLRAHVRFINYMYLFRNYMSALVLWF